LPEFTAEHYFGVNILPGNSFSMTNQDAAYPATNGNDRDPSKPLKATGNSTVITLGAVGALEGFAIIHHNLFGATVTLAAGGGFSQAMTIPANTADGQPVNPWLDLRDAAGRTGSWTLTITGASANVWIGELVGVTDLQPMPLLLNVEFAKRHPIIKHTTFYHHDLKYDRGIRYGRATGSLIDDDDRQLVLDLWDATRGPLYPFLFIPDVDVNRAWLAEFSDEEMAWTRGGPDYGDLRVVIKETVSGLIP
jgi:hypothetical protein